MEGEAGRKRTREGSSTFRKADFLFGFVIWTKGKGEERCRGILAKKLVEEEGRQQ